MFIHYPHPWFVLSVLQENMQFTFECYAQSIDDALRIAQDAFPAANDVSMVKTKAVKPENIKWRSANELVDAAKTKFSQKCQII